VSTLIADGRPQVKLDADDGGDVRAGRRDRVVGGGEASDTVGRMMGRIAGRMTVRMMGRTVRRTMPGIMVKSGFSCKIPSQADIFRPVV
jgi:hypothetical protein